MLGSEVIKCEVEEEVEMVANEEQLFNNNNYSNNKNNSNSSFNSYNNRQQTALSDYTSQQDQSNLPLNLVGHFSL